ncbi:MAG: PAS domain S-box protein [Fidelibacterota bacterium]
MDEHKNPVDLEFLEVNEEFKEITGLTSKKVVTERFSNLFPTLKKSGWIEKYGEIALHGGEKTFEQYSESLDKWYRIRAFSPEKNYLATIVFDISDEMHLLRYAGNFLRHTSQDLDYQEIADNLYTITNAVLVAFNLFDEKEKCFQTTAVAGVSGFFQNLSGIIGFPIIDRKWYISDDQYQEIKATTTTCRDNLAELFRGTSHDKLAKLFTKTPLNNPVCEINIKVNGRIIGDFILVLRKNDSLENETLVKLYARLIGLAVIRQRFRKQLERSTAELNLVLDATENGFWDCDLKNQTVHYNDIYFTMLGYDPGELPHTMDIFKELMHPDDQKNVIPIINKLIGQGKSYEMSFRLKTKAGDWKWILGKGRGYQWSESGTVERALGVHIDIDNIKKMEEKLQESLNRLNLITKNIPNVIWSATINEKGDFADTYISETVDKLLNLPAGSIGHSWNEYFKYVYPEYMPLILKKFEEGIKKPGQVLDFEYKVKKGNGEAAWFHSAGKCYTKHGLPRFFGYTADISEQKKIHSELEKSRERFRKAEKLGKVGNWEFDLQTKKFWGSEGAKAIYGFNPNIEKFSPDDIEKCIPERKNVHQSLINLIEYQQEYNLEFDIITKNSSVRKTIISKAELEIDRNKKPLKVTGVLQDITDIRKKEEKLRESEARNRLLFEASADAIMHMKDEQFVDCNPATLEILNADRDYIIGKKPSQISPEKQENGEYSYIKERKMINKALEKGTHRFDWTLIKQSGGLLYVEVQLTLLPSDDQHIFLNVAWRDLTVRKKMEQQLKTSENHFHALFEYAPTPLWEEDFSEVKKYLDKLTGSGIKNPDNYFDNHPEEVKKCLQMIRVLRLNTAAKKLHGAKSKEELIDNLDKIITRIAFPQFKQELVAMAENRDFCTFDMTASTIQGETIYTNVYWKVVPGHEKTMDKVFVSTIEITDRILAARKIKENEERLKSITDALPDLVIEMDKKGNYTYFNATNKQDVYTQSLNMTGKNIYDTLPENISALTREKIKKTLQEQKIQSYEYSLPMEDGEQYYECRMVPKGDDHVLAIVRNITDRKLLEEENKKLEQLRNRSQKLETIGTLAGGIAHDFNNMLTPIMGYSDMIRARSKGRDDELYEEISEILQASRRAKELVEQMLSFSREAEQERKPLNIVPVIKEALKLIRSSIPESIDINIDIDRVDVKILADPTKIHQVIMNLATNAFHAMEEKGGVLSVTLEKPTISEQESMKYPDLTAGDYLKLTVTDTGCGMDNRTIDRIFEPFFTTKDEGKGTGMGLSVVHGIIKSHDGAIHVNSIPGKGAAFIIYLPVIQQEKSIDAGGSEKPLLGGTETIMVVDDREYISKMIKNMLASYGYQVYVYNSSTDALTAYQQHSEKFDLVITDRNMPNMTGLELAEQITKNDDVPVLMITGQGHNLSQELLIKAGILKLIQKPILLEEIIQTIRDVLDER